jgi:hypothetical protein
MGYVVFQVIENQVRHGLHFGKGVSCRNACIIKRSQHVVVYLCMVYQVELTRQYCLDMPRIPRLFL